MIRYKSATILLFDCSSSPSYIKNTYLYQINSIFGLDQSVNGMTHTSLPFFQKYLYLIYLLDFWTVDGQSR